MPIYKVTVAVRGVASIHAANDAEAGTILYDYLDRLLKAGKAAHPAPEEIQDIGFDIFIQAATSDEST